MYGFGLLYVRLLQCSEVISLGLSLELSNNAELELIPLQKPVQASSSQFEFSQRFGFVISMEITANGSRKSNRVAAKEASKPKESKQPKLKKTMLVVVENEKKKKKQPAGPRSQHSHPPYFHMVMEAITSLRERMGSSHQEIVKYIEAHYKGELPSNFKKLLTNQLRFLAEKGKLVQFKRSFKITKELKKSSQLKAIKAAIKSAPSGNPPAVKNPNLVGQVKAKKTISAKYPKPKAEKKTKVKPAGKSKPKAVSKGKSVPPLAPSPASAPPDSTPKVQKTAYVASIKKEKPSPSKAAKSKPIKTSTLAKSTPAPRKYLRAAPPVASKKPITNPPPKKKKKTA